MSLWLQTPVRQLEERQDHHLRFLLRGLAWAMENGETPLDALRAQRSGWSLVALQALALVAWLGGRLLFFVLPMRRLRLATLMLMRDLERGQSLAAAAEKRWAMIMHGHWLALLGQAERAGHLPATLKWLAEQPGLSRPVYPGPLALVLVYGWPCFVIVVAGLLFELMISSKSGRMFREMGVPAREADFLLGLLPRFRIENEMDGIALLVVLVPLAFVVLRLLLSMKAWQKACGVLRRVPWLGRPWRWQAQAAAAQALTWSLGCEPRLDAALAMAAAGSDPGWPRQSLTQVQSAVTQGQDWVPAWQAAGLVDASDAWLLHQGQRLEQPSQALATLAAVLLARTEHSVGLRELALRLALIGLQGLIVWYLAYWMFTGLTGLVASLAAW